MHLPGIVLQYDSAYHMHARSKAVLFTNCLVLLQCSFCFWALNNQIICAFIRIFRDCIHFGRIKTEVHLIDLCS